MKLSTVNPRLQVDVDSFVHKDVITPDRLKRQPVDVHSLSN
jgi:hypothetical protein